MQTAITSNPAQSANSIRQVRFSDQIEVIDPPQNSEISKIRNICSDNYWTRIGKAMQFAGAATTGAGTLVAALGGFTAILDLGSTASLGGLIALVGLAITGLGTFFCWLGKKNDEQLTVDLDIDPIEATPSPQELNDPDLDPEQSALPIEVLEELADSGNQSLSRENQTY